jgi:putative resolvase
MSLTGFTRTYVIPKAAAKILGCHVDTVSRLANDDKIRYIKTPGGQRRYDVQGYIDSQTESDITTVCYCRVSGKGQTNASR